MAYDAGAEGTFLVLINETRAAVGAPPLRLDPSLRAAARAWAVQLQGNGALSHQPLGRFLDSFNAAAENVAYAYSVDQAHAALLNSPGHYTNLTNPAYTVIGIGVVVDPDGRLWTAHVFAG